MTVTRRAARLSREDLVTEVIACEGRPLLDLARALGYGDPRALARRLRRIAAALEVEADAEFGRGRSR